MDLKINSDLHLACQKQHFSIPDDVSYLNCAYMSPLSHQVIETGQQALLTKAKPYEIFSDDFFQPVQELKVKFAELIDADNPDRIVIIPSASYAFSTIAKNLPVDTGQNLVVLEEQFPSNVYCWHRLCKERSLELRTIPPPDVNRETAWNEKILNAIDDRTAMVSMGILHWTDGTVFNLQAIRQKTRRFGAKLVLDGTQAIGALPFSVSAIEPDALVCAAYKWLMGPYSIGLAYFGPEFDDGIPLEENWINRVNSNDFRAQVGYQPQYRPFATRYDMGEKSNFILVPMVSSALSQIKQWGVGQIQQYCRSITTTELSRLRDMGFGLADDNLRCGHLFGLRPPGNFKWELVTRALEEAKVHVSFRGDSIRVSPHIYNSPRDIAKLVDCLVRGLP